ncbi:hypothetical protein M3J07_010791 [Ascochyta lentis]
MCLRHQDLVLSFQVHGLRHCRTTSLTHPESAISDHHATASFRYEAQNCCKYKYACYVASYTCISKSVLRFPQHCVLHSFRVWSLVIPIKSVFHNPVLVERTLKRLPVKMRSTIVTFAMFSAAFGTPIRRQTDNIQTFTSALGGIAATPVEDSGNPDRPFQVKDDTFANIGAALARSCDQQFNACANAANGGDATLSITQCSTQKDQCSASIQASTAGAQDNAQADAAGNADANENELGNNGSNASGNSAGAGVAATCT